MAGVEDLFHKLPRALNVRRRLLADLLRDPPDLFLGIDSPDFNLTLERKLRNAGIPTAHLVSPTVWAWRGYRLRKIRKSVDHMLVLFPFEEIFYRERGIPATCVGHPAARETAELDRAILREKFGLEGDEVVIAVLPGSQGSPRLIVWDRFSLRPLIRSRVVILRRVFLYHWQIRECSICLREY